MCTAIVYDARHEWHEMIESDKYELYDECYVTLLLAVLRRSGTSLEEVHRLR